MNLSQGNDRSVPIGDDTDHKSTKGDGAWKDIMEINQETVARRAERSGAGQGGNRLFIFTW